MAESSTYITVTPALTDTPAPGLARRGIECRE